MTACSPVPNEGREFAAFAREAFDLEDIRADEQPSGLGTATSICWLSEGGASDQYVERFLSFVRETTVLELPVRKTNDATDCEDSFFILRTDPRSGDFQTTIKKDTTYIAYQRGMDRLAGPIEANDTGFFQIVHDGREAFLYTFIDTSWTSTYADSIVQQELYQSIMLMPDMTTEHMPFSILQERSDEPPDESGTAQLSIYFEWHPTNICLFDMALMNLRYGLSNQGVPMTRSAIDLALRTPGVILEKAKKDYDRAAQHNLIHRPC